MSFMIEPHIRVRLRQGRCTVPDLRAQPPRNSSATRMRGCVDVVLETCRPERIACLVALRSSYQQSVVCCGCGVALQRSGLRWGREGREGAPSRACGSPERHLPTTRLIFKTSSNLQRPYRLQRHTSRWFVCLHRDPGDELHSSNIVSTKRKGCGY